MLTNAVIFQVQAFNKEMEEARNRYNDLQQLNERLKELQTQEISKYVNNNKRFMTQVKSAVEVCIVICKSL